MWQKLKAWKNGARAKRSLDVGMICAWADFAGDDAVKWIEEQFDSPGFAPWLMRTFTGEGTAQSFGDLVGRRIFTVDRKSLAKLFDVDRLAATARNMVEEGKDPDLVAAHFLQGLGESALRA